MEQIMNPRTAKESALHILAELRADRLGAMNGTACVYEDDIGNHCGVGCLFTPAQHKWIQDRGLTAISVSVLRSEIGAANMSFVTGMTKDNLIELQTLHDAWARHTRADDRKLFEEFLQNIIAA